jgi:hypothetical protein
MPLHRGAVHQLHQFGVGLDNRRPLQREIA